MRLGAVVQRHGLVRAAAATHAVERRRGVLRATRDGPSTQWIE